MSKIQLIDVPSEIGAGTRGASLGFEALKVACLNAESDFFKKYPALHVQDENYALFNAVNTPFAKRIAHIQKVYERIVSVVGETIEKNQFPLLLSGDHSTAGGTIAGLKLAHPDKTIGVVWIDAHADLHSPYTSPSGNVHGMPLATALAEDNLPSRIPNRQLSQEGERAWKAIQELGGISPKIEAENLVFFGVRDTETPEDELIERLGVKNYTVDEVRYRGLERCVNETTGSLSNCDMIYISFDVDSMDSNLISHGTGTPVPYGFNREEVKSIMSMFIQTGKVAALEFVEINPTLDEKCNLMAETAFSILEELTEEITQQKSH